MPTSSTGYDYAPDARGRTEWHVNFADPHLFGMYEWALFAQDEIQVAEHPALGSVRDALTKGRIPPAACPLPHRVRV